MFTFMSCSRNRRRKFLLFIIYYYCFLLNDSSSNDLKRIQKQGGWIGAGSEMSQRISFHSDGKVAARVKWEVTKSLLVTLNRDHSEAGVAVGNLEMEKLSNYGGDRLSGLQPLGNFLEWKMLERKKKKKGEKKKKKKRKEFSRAIPLRSLEFDWFII